MARADAEWVEDMVSSVADIRTNMRRIWDVVLDDIDGLENALRRP
jgi:hypothetical protein